MIPVALAKNQYAGGGRLAQGPLGQSVQHAIQTREIISII